MLLKIITEETYQIRGTNVEEDKGLLDDCG